MYDNYFQIHSQISETMSFFKQIQSALISVYDKSGLEEIIHLLAKQNVKLYSTGGTQRFIEDLGYKVTAVEDLSSYPAIFGGRVKTLHPKIFGAILYRRNNPADVEEARNFEIPDIDLVIVDLYPFEKTLASGAAEDEIIEKIDIGGISLIRAAAKNFSDVMIVPAMEYYAELLHVLKENNGFTKLETRKTFAQYAFQVSSHYDSAIYNYFAQNDAHKALRLSKNNVQNLRYGENPHQNGQFIGNLNELFEQMHGKPISYNNLLDVDAALQLISEFKETTCAILKHNNACGLASREALKDAYAAALEGDPVSAFGGVIVVNKVIDKPTAELMNQLFFEVLIAPGFDSDALSILIQKKNRILLLLKKIDIYQTSVKSALNGFLVQERDTKTEQIADLKCETAICPNEKEMEDLVFANIIVKHTKSNAIVLAKDKQLIASGAGETSRIDALKHAIDKAKHFKLDLSDAVMASDAFFPFADSVETAFKNGIKCVIQPGGSVRDQESIDFCNKHHMAMVFTGIRHFKH